MARLVQLDHVEIQACQDLWVCPALKDAVGCLFQEKLADKDQKEKLVILGYLDRKVHLG